MGASEIELLKTTCVLIACCSVETLHYLSKQVQTRNYHIHNFKKVNRYVYHATTCQNICRQEQILSFIQKINSYESTHTHVQNNTYQQLPISFCTEPMETELVSLSSSSNIRRTSSSLALSGISRSIIVFSATTEVFFDDGGTIL